MAKKIEVLITGDADSLTRAFGKAENATQKASKGIQKAAKWAGLGIAVGLGVTAKVGFDEFMSGQRILAQTNAVIKSTGGVANVTAKHLDTLSQSILKKTGIDDEAVRSGGNMLLTFRNIHNELGKGNDIYDQTVVALTDMATAMNGGATPSADQLMKQSIRLGKALNDPIKGISALTRVGVSFTEGQKKSIKSMVEHGNIAGAQKIILAELTKEFGGSAVAAGETLPGAITKLKERFADFAGMLVGKVIPNILSVIAFFDRHQTVALALGTAIGTMTVLLLAAGAVLKVYAIAQGLAALATSLTAAGVTALQVALAAGLIGAFVLLAVAIVVAYKKSATFRAVVQALGTAAVAVFNAIKAQVMAVIASVGSAIAKVSAFISKVKEVTAGPFATVKAVVGDVIEKVGSAIGKIGDFIAKVKDVTAGPLTTVANVLSTIASWASTAVSHIRDLISAINSIPHPSLPSLPHIPGFGKIASGVGLGAPRMAATGGGGGVVLNVTVNGPVVGQNGMTQLANTIKGEFVAMNKRGSSLGFV